MENKVLAAKKPSDAINAARQQLLKAKVQFDYMHARWKKTLGRFSGAVLFWEAYKIQANFEVSKMLMQEDFLFWSHFTGLLLAFFMTISPWISRHAIVKRVIFLNKEFITVLALAEMILFGHISFAGLNANIFIEEGVSIPNPKRHIPFASALYLVALLADIYMNRQHDKSFQQFKEVDTLYRELLDKEKNAVDPKSTK